MQPLDVHRVVPDFSRVRDALLEAAARQDLDRLSSYLAERVRYHEEDVSAVELAARLRTDRAGGLRLLDALAGALRMGVAMDDELISAPYVAAAGRFLAGLPAGRYEVVTGTNVALREAPTTSARTIQTASHDLVRVVSEADVRDAKGDGSCTWWARVELGASATGWMCADYLASPLDTRFAFGREHGEWRLVSVYEGD